jgi:hypothetical protein
MHDYLRLTIGQPGSEKWSKMVRLLEMIWSDSGMFWTDSKMVRPGSEMIWL